MPAVPVSRVAVPTVMMEIVITLEQAMVTYDPFILLADERRKQVGGHGRMIIGSENVPDIV